MGRVTKRQPTTSVLYLLLQFGQDLFHRSKVIQFLPKDRHTFCIPLCMDGNISALKLPFHYTTFSHFVHSLTTFVKVQQHFYNIFEIREKHCSSFHKKVGKIGRQFTFKLHDPIFVENVVSPDAGRDPSQDSLQGQAEWHHASVVIKCVLPLNKLAKLKKIIFKSC